MILTMRRSKYRNQTSRHLVKSASSPVISSRKPSPARQAAAFTAECPARRAPVTRCQLCAPGHHALRKSTSGVSSVGARIGNGSAPSWRCGRLVGWFFSFSTALLDELHRGLLVPIAGKGMVFSMVMRVFAGAAALAYRRRAFLFDDASGPVIVVSL